MKKALFSIALAMLVVPLAAADDLNPPEWRGMPGSTFQHWTFDTDVTGMAYIPPDIDQNPFGAPTIYDDWSQYGEWLPQYEGRDGVWHVYWDFDIDLPNDPEPRDWKDIYVQFTYFYNDPTGWDNGRPIIDDVVVDGDYNINLVEEYQLEGDWWYSWWHIEIFPNPDFETLHIIADDDYSELIFDQIVIDTLCIPEPGSLALLALGGLALVRRR